MATPLQVKSLSETEVLLQVGGAEIRISVAGDGSGYTVTPSSLPSPVERTTTYKEIRAKPVPLRERRIVDQSKLDPEFLKKFKGVDAECPSCQETLSVVKYFGQRRYKNSASEVQIGKQSYCAECRPKGNYRARPRKYRTRSVT